MKKILLHTCCAPCTTFVNKDLIGKGFSVVGLFYNPNIQPLDEYERRKKTMEQYTKAVNFQVLYAPNDTTTDTQNCEQCYQVRLTKTAVLAKQQGFGCFSTTLLISPYQQHELLKKLGEKIADEIGLEFYYNDWRSGFRQGQQMARELKLYRQKYCGCQPRGGDCAKTN